MLRSYETADSASALTRWAEENQLPVGEAANRLLQDSGAVALFGREAISQMRPNRRTTPYGYTKRDGALIPKPEEAGTVAAFFRMYCDGMSLRQIAEVANEDAIPTSRGGRWQASTIRHILRNPVYIGRVRRKGMVRDGGPPGLIQPDLFETAQREITRRAKRARRSIREAPVAPAV